MLGVLGLSGSAGSKNINQSRVYEYLQIVTHSVISEVRSWKRPEGKVKGSGRKVAAGVMTLFARDLHAL